jgi:hypothetical protein
MTPLGIIDAVHRAARTVRATGDLAFMLSAPGWALLARAWVRRRREWRR